MLEIFFYYFQGNEEFAMQHFNVHSNQNQNIYTLWCLFISIIYTYLILHEASRSSCHSLNGDPCMIFLEMKKLVLFPCQSIQSVEKISIMFHIIYMITDSFYIVTIIGRVGIIKRLQKNCSETLKYNLLINNKKLQETIPRRQTKNLISKCYGILNLYF